MAPRIKLGNSVSAGKDVWLNIIPEATDEVNIIIEDNCRRPADLDQRKESNSLGAGRPSRTLRADSGPRSRLENPNLPISKQPAMEGGRIRIERGCRIGQGAAIVCSRGELVLGQHCVVMPNSVVIRSTPSYCILGGNPARVIERWIRRSPTRSRPPAQLERSSKQVP